jgi:hypothetical protein
MQALEVTATVDDHRLVVQQPALSSPGRWVALRASALIRLAPTLEIIP